MLAERLGCLGSGHQHRCYPKLLFPGELVSSSESFLGRWSWTPIIARQPSPPPAHSRCLLRGLHRTLGLPHSSRLAFPPHSALVAFSLDSLRRRPHLPTPFLFLAASELDPSKIIKGSAETVAGRLQPSLFPGSRLCSPLFIPPHPVFLEAFIRRL